MLYLMLKEGANRGYEENEMEQELKLYRAVYESYEDDSLPSRSHRGRFHDETNGRWTTYLAASADTAWEEVTYRWQADRTSYRMVEVIVKVNKIVDLTDLSTRERYSVDMDVLTAEEYGPCQQLANRLRAEGVEAMWTFSKADYPDGRQLVVFLNRLSEGSYVRVRRIQRMDVEGE